MIKEREKVMIFTSSEEQLTEDDAESLLKFLAQNESDFRPFLEEVQDSISKNMIDKCRRELAEPGSTGNPYKKDIELQKQLDRDIMQTLNNQVFKEGLISEQVYYKAKVEIDKIK